MYFLYGDDPALTGAPIWQWMAMLWNASCVGRHGFFPWTADVLEEIVAPSPRCNLALMIWALDDEKLIGFAQGTEKTGNVAYSAIEMIFVHPDYRKKGIDSVLLDMLIHRLSGDSDKRNVFYSSIRNLLPKIITGESKRKSICHIDASGAWPCGPLYTAFTDGSERSGIFYEQEPFTAQLFHSRGFKPYRTSVVMRRPITDADILYGSDEFSIKTGVLQFKTIQRSRWRWKENPENNSTLNYLDETFRLWTLYDVKSFWKSNSVLVSNCVFARMDGVSEYERIERYSLFAVRTAPAYRRQGAMRAVLRKTFAEIYKRGGEEVELHCYADNMPALRLYEDIGFRYIAKTRAIHLQV